MKRAIYLDERERDLVRRIIEYFAGRLNNTGLSLTYAETVAVYWTRDEANRLLEKFKEPPPEGTD